MEIDVIIEKAKLIKEADNPEGIDNLIKSLESYKANKGDIRKREFIIFYLVFVKMEACGGEMSKLNYTVLPPI